MEVIRKRPLVAASVMTDEKDKVQFSEGRRRHEQTEDNSKYCSTIMIKVSPFNQVDLFR